MKKLIILIIIFLFSSPAFCQDSFFDTLQRQQFEREVKSAQKKQEQQMRELIEVTQRAERKAERQRRLQKQVEQQRARKRSWDW